MEAGDFVPATSNFRNAAPVTKCPVPLRTEEAPAIQTGSQGSISQVIGESIGPIDSFQRTTCEFSLDQGCDKSDPSASVIYLLLRPKKIIGREWLHLLLTFHAIEVELREFPTGKR